LIHCFITALGFEGGQDQEWYGRIKTVGTSFVSGWKPWIGELDRDPPVERIQGIAKWRYEEIIG